MSSRCRWSPPAARSCCSRASSRRSCSGSTRAWRSREWAATVHELRFAILTVTSVLALAYVMNLSGQAATIGHFVAAAGAGLAFLSPVLGWFGVAVSGSDTSANALFGALQVTAARESGLSPGAAGRRQQLRRRARQDDLAAEPHHRLRGRRARGPARATCCARCCPWSLGLLLVMCLIVVGAEHTGAGLDAALTLRVCPAGTAGSLGTHRAVSRRG